MDINDEKIDIEIVKSKGFIIYYKLVDLQRSLDIFKNNYNELNMVFEISQHPIVSMQIASLSLQEITYIYQKYTNFIMSTSMLIEHTRVFMSFYKPINERVYNQYNLDKDRLFAKNDMCCFIKELRNFTTHVGYPEIECLVPLKSNLVTYYLKITLEQYDWNTSSKKFILDNKQKISLNKLSKEYYDLVNNFYCNLLKKISDIHTVDFEETNRLMQLSNRLKGFND